MPNNKHYKCVSLRADTIKRINMAVKQFKITKSNLLEYALDVLNVPHLDGGYASFEERKSLNSTDGYATNSFNPKSQQTFKEIENERQENNL